MKKFLSLIFAGLLCLSAAGCGSQNSGELAGSPSEAVIVGGWQNAEDGTVTDAHRAMFDNALENYCGASFTPVRLVATQVVAGTNYEFLCEETLIAATPVKSEKYVVLYCDLEGNCEITSVEDTSVTEG